MAFFDSDTMTAAAGDLSPAVSRSASWMAPPGQRNFLDPGTIQTLAMVLAGAFLAGVQERAVKEAKIMGGKVAGWLSRQITRLFEGEPAELAEIEGEAEAGSQAITAESAADSEEMIVALLSEKMPEAEARALAGDVRQAVEARLAGQ